MIITKKIWGTTEALMRTPMFEMHRLCIKPLHRCSFHVHQFKHNAFYVLYGSLYIDWIEHEQTTPTRSSGCPLHEATLCKGDTIMIRPGVYHQFRTGELDCVALEMYYTEPLSEDIIRRNVGGPL